MQNARDDGERNPKAHMLWLFPSAVLGMALVTGIGCGTLSYKTGGTAGDYQAARDRCQKEGRAEGPDLERCMQDQGWVSKRFGAPTAPSGAQTTRTADTPPPARMPAGGDASGSVTADRPSEASQPAPAGAPANGPASGNAPGSRTAGDQPEKSQPAAAAGDGAAPPALGGPPQGPIVVKNWFKLGGTAADLDAARQRCATKLGGADRAEPDSETVTPAMLDCLRDEGWHPF